MNAIAIKERVEFYMDTTRNARFSFLDINKAVNDAIRNFINDMFGSISGQNPYSFQSTQQIRDDLYTLIKTSTPAVTTLSPYTTNYDTFIVNHINLPTDYYELIAIQTLIGGVTNYARPMEMNERGPLLEDSFKKPSNRQPYYLEDSTGYKIYRANTGTLTTATIDYIKTPNAFTIGNESQLIAPGNNLTIGLDYIAVKKSVNNTVTYMPGQLFNAGATNLVSGQVILASNTQTTDLPDKTHEIIAKMAAEIMSGVTADYTRSQYTEKQAKDSQ